jgi:hypothetical protein
MKAIQYLIASLVLFATAVESTWADAPSAKKENDKLLPVARFIGGQWAIDGRWDSGEELHARSIYEWGLNKKFVKARTFVNNRGVDYQRYEAIFGFDPAKKSLYEVSFSFDGRMSEYTIEPKDASTLQIGWSPFGNGETPRIRQTIQFQDDNTFTWTVWMKDKGDWKRLIEGTWRRKPS